MRIWDFAAAQRPDYFIANSNYIQKRIKKFYQRDAVVVYPPVDTTFYNPKQTEIKKGNFYLFVGRFVPYKKADLVIEAFNKLGTELRLIGSGSEEEKLKKIAGENIKFLGRASDDVLRKNLESAKAVIFPSEEDFGIVPVEALACGTPVIAFGVGGAKETVIEGVTGEFFLEQTPESLIEIVKKFDPTKYKFANLRTRAEEFSNEIFAKKFSSTVEKMYFEYQKQFK